MTKRKWTGLLSVGIVFILTCLCHWTVYSQSDCEYQRQERGVKVYTCKTENSPYHGVKAEFELKNCSLEEYKLFLMDWKRYTEWKYRVVFSELIEDINPNEIICYTKIDSPWPVTDRDMVEHLTLTHDTLNNTLTMDIKLQNDYMPENEEYVRIPQSHSVLSVKQSGGNTLKAEYYIEANPGGSIPSWVVNMVSVYGPIETFGSVKQLLNKSTETQ